MKLLSVEITGATGLQKVGKTVALDFTRFDAGVIAIVGDNGMGKSTFMRLMTPYAVVGLSELKTYEHFFGKDAARVNRYDVGGDVIETKLLIDAVNRKSEGYVTRNGLPLCSGKMGDYEKVVEEIFGSKEFFFQSVFRDQKAISFASVQRSELRSLMAELLDLAKTAEYEKAANEKAASILKEIEKLRASLLVIDTASLGTYQSQIEGLAKKRDLHAGNIVYLTSQWKELLEENQKNKLRLERQKEDRARLVVLRDREEKATKEYHKFVDEHKVYNERLTRALEEMNAVVERCEKIIGNKALIESRVAELASTRERIEVLRSKRDASLELVASRRQDEAKAETRYKDAQRKSAIALTELVALQREFKATTQRTEEDIKRLQVASERLVKLPCSQYPEIQPQCLFISDAVKAKDEIPVLQSKLDAHKVTHEEEEMRKSNVLTALREEEERAEQVLQVLKEQADKSEREHDSASLDSAIIDEKKLVGEKWDALLTEATVAEEKRDAARERIKGIEEELVEREEKRREAEPKLLAAIDAEQAEILSVKKSLEEFIGDYSNAVHAKEYDIEEEKKRLQATEKEISVLEVKLEEAKKAKAKAIEIEAEIAAQEKEYKECAVLARACGKTGIQALELDESGQYISEISNDLLSGSNFGTNFRIRFDTQRINSKGEMLEDYRITVLSDKGEQDMRTLSGGEDVWVNAAIMQAIAIYRMRASEHRIDTMFLDEVDGALTVARANDYLNMVRRTQQIAGLHQTIIITHRKELQDQIPQQIRLMPGKVEIK